MLFILSFSFVNDCHKLSKSLGPAKLNTEMANQSDEIQWDDFSERKPNHDVALVVGQQKFWVSKAVLTTFSPVFMTTFYGDFQEANKKKVELKDKDPNDVLEMLRCIIPSDGAWKTIDFYNLAAMSKLGDEYQISFITRQCASRLKSITGTRF